MYQIDPDSQPLFKCLFALGEFWDVVCSRRKLNRESGLRWMEKNEAMITTTETIAFRLLKEVETDEFKRLSKFVK
jgi:hypothetical protein